MLDEVLLFPKTIKAFEEAGKTVPIEKETT